MPALEVENLTKTYTRRGRGGAPATRVHAAAGVSLTAQPGQITAVLGPNGAGKTTTLECCEGVRTQDSGRIEVLGRPRPASARTDQWLRERVGVMVQSGGLPMVPRAREVLEHLARFYPAPADLAHLTQSLALTDALDTRIRRLSGGQRQRLAVACALVGRPELVFLDEPTSGVDPHARRRSWELLREHRDSGTAVVLTTHHLDEAEELADHVVIMARGRVVAAGAVSELAHGYRVTVTGACDPRRAAAVLSRLGAVSSPAEPEVFTEEIPARELATLAGDLTAAGEGDAVVHVARRTLESVYLELTREEA